eukprot:jgi/Chrzof1/25/Cz01g00260.t1
MWCVLKQQLPRLFPALPAVTVSANLLVLRDANSIYHTLTSPDFLADCGATTGSSNCGALTLQSLPR